jgi:hypothetical protein
MRLNPTVCSAVVAILAAHAAAAFAQAQPTGETTGAMGPASLAEVIVTVDIGRVTPVELAEIHECSRTLLGHLGRIKIAASQSRLRDQNPNRPTAMSLQA